MVNRTYLVQPTFHIQPTAIQLIANALVSKPVSNLGTNKTGESKGGEVAGVDAPLVQVANIDLHRGMVLGCDQPVCGRTEMTEKE